MAEEAGTLHGGGEAGTAGYVDETGTKGWRAARLGRDGGGDRRGGDRDGVASSAKAAGSAASCNLRVVRPCCE